MGGVRKHDKNETSRETYSILYSNVRSILNKLPELQSYVAIHLPDLIMLCETFLTPDKTNALVALDGYNIVVRKDGKDTVNGKCRGLIVYCKSELKAAPFANAEMESFVESLGVKIPWGNDEMKIVLVYRPPRAAMSADDNGNTVELCKLIKSISGPTVMLGDFNLSGICWERNYSSNAGEREFLKNIGDKFLTQHVDFSTHEDGNILDLVLSSSPELVAGVSNEGPLATADHVMIDIKLVGPARDRNSVEMVPDWRKADLEAMKVSVGAIDWDVELEGLGGVEAWDTFKEIISRETEKCVPLMKRRQGSKPLWMTKNVMRIIRKKRRIWKGYAGKWGKHDYENFEAFKKVQQEVKKEVRNAKKNYERKLAKNRKKNSKSFYSYLKKKTSNRVSVGPLVDDSDGNKLITDDSKMAEMLNAFFCSVFTREDLSRMPEAEHYFQGEESERLKTVHITEEKVKKKLLNLRPSSAPGPDRMWPRVLFSLAGELSYPLAVIYTRCLAQETVPPEWKTANVTPIFKKGAKGSSGNYRPVSLTCVLCKVMESIIRDAIMEHLDMFKLIRSSQHGFMAGRSCVTNLLEYLEELTKLVDRGASVDVVYLDFAKAFDKVPISRLLEKCRGLGIEGNILGWIKSWLSGRKQRVVVNGQASSWGQVLSGVPQGSVLGPTLFLIYINDIDNAVDVTGSVLKKFADDTKWAMVTETEQDRQLFQRGLDNLVQWSIEWQMLFNVDKCHVIHMGRKNHEFSYNMGGRPLEAVNFEKDVGVMIDSSLKPSLQCSKAAKKGQVVLGQLARALTYRDKVTFFDLYKTYVRPHLEYAVQAWSPWNIGDKELLESVQKRAVGMISNLRGRTYQERLAELGETTLETRRQRGDMIQTYRILSGKDKVSYSTWFTLAEQAPAIDIVRTRSETGYRNIKKIEAKGEVRRNSFAPRVVDPWNSLPNKVKEAPTVNTFKNMYDDLHKQR